MPSKPYDPTKPTFYLDTSTHWDAFLAARRSPKTRPEYAPLFTWITRVANEANLCLSTTHLGEVSFWDPASEGDALAGWWDQLQIVWVTSVVETGLREAEHWTKRAAGMVPEPFRPFANALVAAINEMTPNMSADFLADPTVPRVVSDFRTVGWDRVRQAAFPMAADARDDRQEAARAGVTPTRLAEHIARKEVEAIKAHAREADARLTKEIRDAEYRAASVDPARVQDRLVDIFQRDPHALPSFRMARGFDAAFFDAAEKRSPGSRKEQQQLPGALGDRMHAYVGGAYCDVFTCDWSTSQWAGPARGALGLSQPIVVGQHPGGPSGFTAELMASWR